MSVTTSLALNGSDNKSSRKERICISRKITLDILVFLELVSIFVAAYIAKVIYIETYLKVDIEFSNYFFLAIITSVIFYFISKHQGHYKLKKPSKSAGDILRIVTALMLSFLIAISALYFAKVSENFSRGWLFFWFIFSLLALFSLRYLSAYVLALITARGSFRRRVVVVGSGQWVKEITARLLKGDTEYKCLDKFDIDLSDYDFADRKKRLSDIVTHISHLVKNSKIDQIIIAPSSADFEWQKQLVYELRSLNVDVHLVPEVFSSRLSVQAVSNISDLTTLSVQKKTSTNVRVVLKNLEDLILGSIFFTASVIPMVMIALCIKLDSRGSIFSIQQRSGLNGRLIRIIKFRTTTMGKDSQALIKLTESSEKLTRMGRVLRKFNLDELPQLWNVLRGEMSVVGPEPHPLEHDYDYSKAFEIYANGQSIKPGIISLADANGLSSPEKTLEERRKSVDFDMHYIENWSLWLDIKIIMKVFCARFIKQKILTEYNKECLHQNSVS